MSTPDAASMPRSAGSAEPAAGTRWSTLGVVTLGTFLLALDLTVVNVALPSLRTTLKASFSDLQWVIDAYAVTLAVFLLTSGTLADRFGRKKVYNVGFLIFTAASLMCGLAWNILSLNVARGIQGVGAAVLFAVGPALMGQEFRGKQRGIAFGIFGGGVGMGLALGPLIGGALTDGIGWRWIFLVNVPVGVICLLFGLFGMRESRDRDAHRVDWTGLVTFCAALALLVLALLRGEREGWTSPLILGMFGVALVMLVVFVAVERRKGPAAMLDLSLFRNRTFNGISAVALVMTGASMSAIFLLILYTQNVVGYSAWETGVRFLWLTGALFVAAGIGGGLTSKVPFRIIVGVSGVLLAVGLALIKPMLERDPSWESLLPSMILMGLGIGMYNPARASISIAVVEPRKAGMASGINETFQQSGWALGVAAFGALFQARVSHHFLAATEGQLGPQADKFGEAIAAGGIDTVVKALPPPLADQVAQAARQAFLDGMIDVTPVTAILAGVAALIGFVFITNKDLDPSALSGLPGVPPEIADDEPGDARHSVPPAREPVGSSRHRVG